MKLAQRQKTLKGIVAVLASSTMWSMTACGASNSKKDEPPMVESRTDTPNTYKALTGDEIDWGLVNELQEQSLMDIENDRCVGPLDSLNFRCKREMTEVSFDDGQFKMNQSTNEPILLAEGTIDRFLATVRHRNRAMAFYMVQKGEVKPYNPKIKISPTLKRIFERFQISEFIPAHTLTKLGDAIYERYQDHFSKYMSHNSTIFDTLVEYNPRSPLVFMDGFGHADKTFDKNILCSYTNLRSKKKHVDQRMASMKRSLKSLLDRHHIAYSSFSMGISEKDKLKNLRNICESKRDSSLRQLARYIAEKYKELFAVVFNNPGTLSVQSSPYNSGDNGPSDCKGAYLNRLIVGSLNMPDSNIPEKGAHTITMTEEESFVKRGYCPDIYVNFNIDYSTERDTAETFSASFGEGFGNIRIGRKTSVSTSNAAPLLLSYLIYLRHKHFADEEMNDTTVQKILELVKEKRCGEDGDKSCKYLDPLKHHQAQVFELGYRRNP